VQGDFFWVAEFLPDAELSLALFPYDNRDAPPLWEGIRTSDNFGFVHVGPEEHGVNLEAGNLLVVSDGRIEDTLLLESITIEMFDLEQGLMAGTAPPERFVYVVAADGPDVADQTAIETESDASGAWSADFDLTFTDEWRGWSFAQIFDDDGDTNETSTPPPPPSPRFTVFPEGEGMDGYDWPDGTVTVTVDGKTVCSTEKTSEGGFFNGAFPDGCDVTVGDLVTFFDGTTTRTHTVRNLGITEMDADANRVAGTADTGAVVHVWVHEHGETEMQLTVEDGAWTADFSPFDLEVGMCGRSEIRDDQGNSTAVDWCLEAPPAMSLRVNYGHDWVESFYEAGHNVDLRVTDRDGAVKATASVVTEPKDFWDGETGVQTAANDWTSGRPDIPPATGCTKWTTELRPRCRSATFTEVDKNTDCITGTIDAPGSARP
jgi:hypothetical protein